MNVLICARKNSKGLVGKNLKLLDGIPLIVHSIKTAKSIPAIDNIIVSTDCDVIAETAEKAGAKVPFLRPDELAEDNSPEWLVWRHAIENYFDNKSAPMVVLPPTGPLRKTEDVIKAIDLFKASDCDIVITTTPAHRNPHFNMVKSGADGVVELAQNGETRFHRRQDAPDYFDITTNCYVVDPMFIMEKNNIFDGKVRQVVVPHETAVDIDNQLDLDWAEFLIKRSHMTL